MKLVITIAVDNSAFNGKDCEHEPAGILQNVTDRVDLESKSGLIGGSIGYVRDRRQLRPHGL